MTLITDPETVGGSFRTGSIRLKLPADASWAIGEMYLFICRSFSWRRWFLDMSMSGADYFGDAGFQQSDSFYRYNSLTPEQREAERV